MSSLDLGLATAGSSLGALVLETAARFPDRPALSVRGEIYSYRQLITQAGRIARVVGEVERPHPRLGAVFASRSMVAYSGVLGTLLSGAGYVPLNPKFPVARNAHMLNASGARTLIVGAECSEDLDGLLAATEAALVVIAPELADTSALEAAHPRHRFVGRDALASAQPRLHPPAIDPAAIAYLLFTSGSTGAPKGVMVSHANVLAFLAAMWPRYEVTEHDRCSQSFDLTFDLSAFDLFMAWGRGASVHCIPQEALMTPDDFIRSAALTIWFSVPSVGMMLRKLRRLKPDAFPSLRLALFCGERLPAVVAEDWQGAAPNAIVENLYGPTEATIACTLHRWTPASVSVDGVVPIGRPYPAMTAVIVDPALALVARGDKGELCVKGPQVAHGYWQDPTKTAERFVAMPWYAGPDNRWYRTGDLAYVDDRGDLVHAGRNDDQIKLRGFRIELPEVEHVVREVAGTSFAVVLPFPADANGVQGLTAVVVRGTLGEDEILDAVKQRLPDYMVPGGVAFVAEMPLNANGKIDKPELLGRLQRGEL